MRQQIRLGFLVISIISLIGCGGGSSSSSTSTSSSGETGTGTYVDSAVSGISYTCGTETGITDIDGTFNYELNSSCTFALNGLTLRVVDRSELEGRSTKVFENDISVARLLQSLDDDSNASNGITISEEMLAALQDNNISSLPSTFEEVEEIIEILKASDLLTGTNFTLKGCAKRSDEVLRHLSDTRRGLRGSDTTAPVITVLGDNPLSILRGKTYTDLGAQAIDRVDGQVDVTTVGSVDTSTLGTYTLTYTASDDCVSYYEAIPIIKNNFRVHDNNGDGFIDGEEVLTLEKYLEV